MKIPLKKDAKPVKQRPYRLNPKYKEKLKQELEKMLAAGIIEPVEEGPPGTAAMPQSENESEDIRELSEDEGVADRLPQYLNPMKLGAKAPKKHAKFELQTRGLYLMASRLLAT